MILTGDQVWHFSFSDILLRDVQLVHKAELGLNHQAHYGLELSVLVLLSAMPSADWGLSASPASQTPSLLCSVFPVGNTKAAVCAFVPVSGFEYLTHTFSLLFLKRKAFFAGSREGVSWMLFHWAGGLLWRRLTVFDVSMELGPHFQREKQRQFV